MRLALTRSRLSYPYQRHSRDHVINCCTEQPCPFASSTLSTYRLFFGRVYDTPTISPSTVLFVLLSCSHTLSLCQMRFAFAHVTAVNDVTLQPAVHVVVQCTRKSYLTSRSKNHSFHNRGRTACTEHTLIVVSSTHARFNPWITTVRRLESSLSTRGRYR